MTEKLKKSISLDFNIIYTTFIMMSIMYHYRDSLVYLYGAAALVISAVVFRIFDYIAKHRVIGAAAYAAVFSAFISAARYCVNRGSEEYPISFGIWFLTPQDSLEYSKWYTLAIFLLFMIFMSSVIYYFTKVRYRVFMNFLIFIIPFAIYGKEYEKMPTIFIMLLTTGYIISMIQCRSLTDRGNEVIVNRKSAKRSAAIYIIAFVGIAAILPKPDIEADRTILEHLISAEALTDRLVAMLNVFRDTTDGEQFRNTSDETVLYYVKSADPMRLKTHTFTYYDYDTDSWSVSDADTKYDYRMSTKKIEFPETGAILDAISLAVQKDSYFAAEYGLEDFSTENMKRPTVRNAVIYAVSYQGSYAPVPQNPASLEKSSSQNDIALLKGGTLYCTDGQYFSRNEMFEYTYYADTFFNSNTNKQLVDMMSRDDYYEILADTAVILGYDEDEPGYVAARHYWQRSDAEACLDYGDNEQIYNLANEITEGLTSDYEKAKAIERYFTLNDYVYDMSYQKAEGEDAEYFLFESKRGVCYEFATSMVLLARAAGIPARYCEGYSMTEMYDNEELGTNYVVKSKAAHGFPELYIRGVGWVSFEPTVAADEEVQTDTSSASSGVSTAGIILLTAAVIFLLLVKLYPAAEHRFFIIRIRHTSSDESAVLIMKRVRKLFGLKSSLTSHETVQAVYDFCGTDIEFTADLFDAVVYGGQAVSEQEKERAFSEYLIVYDAYKMQRKKNSKQRRKNFCKIYRR